MLKSAKLRPALLVRHTLGKYPIPYHALRLKLISASYWTSNRTSTNAHFGSPEDLAALSDALHARDMFLMLDITVNNLATTVPPNSSTSPRASASANGAQQFHPLCTISDQSNQTEVEQCWLPADGVQRGLDGGENTMPGVWFPDVNTEDVLVVKAVLDEAKALIKASGADGVRIGSVKHVREDFWPDFRDAVGVFMLGEVRIPTLASTIKSDIRMGNRWLVIRLNM